MPKPPNFRNQLPENADPLDLDNLNKIERSCDKCIKRKFSTCGEYNYALMLTPYTICDSFKPRPIWEQVDRFDWNRCVRCKFAKVKYFLLNAQSAYCNKFEIPVDLSSRCKDFVRK